MPIRFNLKRTGGKTTTIRAIVRNDGAKYTVATGVSVDVKDWDRKRERCNLNQEANRLLDIARKRIQQAIDATGKPPTQLNPKKPSKKKPEIIETIHAHRIRKEKEATSPHTWRAYSTLISNLKRYHADEKRKEKYLDDISPDYIREFVIWLQAQNYTSSHTHKMVATLKAVIRKLISPEKWSDAKAPQAKPTDQVFLNAEEIRKIEDLQIEPGSTFNKVRDLFLVGCYTGLRFSDWHKVGTDKIQVVNGVPMITITQQKTKSPTTLPITKKLQTLLKKYPRGLPKITNQTLNSNIKAIAIEIGLTETVEITEYRGGTIITTKHPKWELISSHTARRSFATNALLSGIPIFETMKFTGHKTIASFLQYVRTTGQEAAIKYADHPFFTGKPNVEK